ncbi:MAG: acyltransferase family protein [Acidimicrobiales bacterium]|nr:acyltransferase family protein [Acidimicrobiales bacterium]
MAATTSSGGDAPLPGARPAATPRASMPYFPALDGIRALAVAAVLCFHGGFSWAEGGYLGVSTFFTLSGFLITSLLLTEHRSTGAIDRKAFWSRRFRRLMPTALAGMVITTVYGATVATSDQRANLAGDTIAALTYTANWRFILEGRSYGQLFAAPSPLQHFWSLAIEEQFYLVFPLIAAAALGRAVVGRTRPTVARLAAILTVLIAAGIAVPLVFGWDHDRIYYGTDSRSPELLLGAVLAIVVSRRRAAARLAAPGPLRSAVAVGGALAVVLSVVCFATVAQESEWLYRGGFALFAVVTCALVTAALVPVGPVRSALARRPLVYVGTISYGIYVYHWPLFLFVDRLLPDLADAPAFVLKLALTVPLAVASKRWLEDPIRHGARIAGHAPWKVAPIPIAVIAAGAIIVSATAPPPENDFEADQASLEALIAEQSVGATTPPGTTAPPRVAMFGDSTALRTGFGLAMAFSESGEGVLVDGGVELGCSIVREGTMRDNTAEGPNKPFCAEWDTTWAQAADEDQPDVAVIQTGPWDVIDHQLPGDPVWRAPGDPVFDAVLADEMRGIVELFAERDIHVVWLTLPELGAPEGEDPFEWRGPGSDPARAERYNELLRQVAAEQPDAVTVVDLAAWLADSGEDRRLRPDGTHFTNETAREVADRFLIAEILAAANGAATTSGTTSGG